MNTLHKYVPLLASAMLMYLVLFIIYPHYQYYIDPDGTAYLTIAKRYADGDYARAINGYWSPWACWLTALLIKQGLAPIPASVIINTLGATGFLFITQSFFLRFNIIARVQWLLSITVALFLCFAIFWQSFDDLWECFFLLSTLRIMIAVNFRSRPVLWVLCGFIGALAYFAKSYSFPFFILNTICCTWFICWDNKVQWFKISVTAIVVMVLCSLPWIAQLHEKYGIWTTATAGPLNTSWYLVGHPYWKDGIGALLPPVYPDSPYYWEDPWVVNGQTPHFWNSWHLFGLQVLRIGLNLWKLLRSMLQISLFMPVVSVMLVRYFSSTRRKNNPAVLPNVIVSLSFLLFPLGYLLVNFEPRYIWYMVPLVMLAGAMFISNHLSSGKPVQKLIPYLFALSFLIYPTWWMVTTYDEGASEFMLAQQLKQKGIKGSFVSNARPGVETRRMVRLAYFSGNPYYAMPVIVPHEQVLKEAQQLNINFYFRLHNEKLPDGNGRQYPGFRVNDLEIIRLD